MAYELEKIELKITDTICLEDSENIDFDGQEFLKEVDIECAKVKRAFKSQVVSFESDELLKRYFHFHQESLIELINTIHANARPCRTEFLNNSILPRLSALLSYIEEHFYEYFDLDIKVPVASTPSIALEIKLFINYLTDNFKGTNVDIALWNS